MRRGKNTDEEQEASDMNNTATQLHRDAMLALVNQHLGAEGAGDVEGACAVYTDDIEHDVVGFPGSPTTGKAGAKAFYEHLTANFRTEGEEVLHEYWSDGAVTLESMMTGRVIGSML